MTYWLSYGGGVNSTALAILAIEGTEFRPLRLVWADTQDEKDETYEYIFRVFQPWLRSKGFTLEIVRGEEGVLERWQRLRVTGSRILRTCTDRGKVAPIIKHLAAHGRPEDHQLIGIDSGESHRAKSSQPDAPFRKLYPLVDANIDRNGCELIIRNSGLPVPPKSGCWHCPFMRKSEVLDLINNRPDRFQAIADLEAVATATHGESKDGARTQWGKRTTAQWRAIAEGRAAQMELPLYDPEPEGPHGGCYDGGDACGVGEEASS